MSSAAGAFLSPRSMRAIIFERALSQLFVSLSPLNDLSNTTQYTQASSNAQQKMYVQKGERTRMSLGGTGDESETNQIEPALQLRRTLSCCERGCFNL